MCLDEMFSTLLAPFTSHHLSETHSPLLSFFICLKMCILNNMLILIKKNIFFSKLVYIHLKLYMDYFYNGVLQIRCKLKIFMNI